MKIVRLVGLLALAVAAMSLAAASSASAAVPLFNPASGTFTSISGPGTLKASSDTVFCKKDTNVGTITSSMSVGGVVVHFLECTSSGASKANCEVNSVGAAKGLIITNALHGILGTVLPSGLAGLLLLPIATKKFVTLEANACTPETAITGSVAGLITPVGRSQTTGKLTLLAPSGKQEIKDIDTLFGLVEPELVAFSATATEETEDELTYSQAIEVM